MSLPEDYLQYKDRRYGQDIDRYRWSPAPTRRPCVDTDLPSVSIAIVVPLEFFPLTPREKPFRHPGAMVTPYPDLRHYTTRDYGNRVGAFRLLNAFAVHKVRVTFAVNAVLLDRVRPLIEEIISAGHEIAAHGLSTDHIHWGGLPEPEEQRYVETTRNAFTAAGLSPRIWMSPARQQSRRTPDLVRAAGFDVCLDWEPDIVPIDLRTSSGPLGAFPLLNELDDRTLLTVKNHDEAMWRNQIIEAARYMSADAARRGPQCFGFTMTPYISGLPFRMWAVRRILAGLNGLPGTQISTVGEIMEAFKRAIDTSTEIDER